MVRGFVTERNGKILDTHVGQDRPVIYGAEGLGKGRTEHGRIYANIASQGRQRFGLIRQLNCIEDFGPFACRERQRPRADGENFGDHALVELNQRNRGVGGIEEFLILKSIQFRKIGGMTVVSERGGIERATEIFNAQKGLGDMFFVLGPEARENPSPLFYVFENFRVPNRTIRFVKT